MLICRLLLIEQSQNVIQLANNHHKSKFLDKREAFHRAFLQIILIGHIVYESEVMHFFQMHHRVYKYKSKGMMQLLQNEQK